jgi:hypothetical protein
MRRKETAGSSVEAHSFDHSPRETVGKHVRHPADRRTLLLNKGARWPYPRSSTHARTPQQHHQPGVSHAPTTRPARTDGRASQPRGGRPPGQAPHRQRRALAGSISGLDSPSLQHKSLLPESPEPRPARTPGSAPLQTGCEKQAVERRRLSLRPSNKENVRRTKPLSRTHSARAQLPLDCGALQLDLGPGSLRVRDKRRTWNTRIREVRGPGLQASQE